MTILTRGGSKGLMLVRLQYIGSDDEDDVTSAAELVEGAFVFARGWIEPLAVNLQVEFCDSDLNSAGHPPDNDQVLVDRALPPDVQVIVLDGITAKYTDRLDEVAIRAFVSAAIDQPAPAGCVTTIQQMSWESLRVRFPSDEEIEMEWGDEPYLVRSELRSGERWVLGRTN